MPGPGIIVFTDNNGAIFTINPDGTGLTEILGAPLGGFWWTIAVSAIGNQVLTTMQTGLSTFTLWRMAGGGIGQLTNVDAGTPVEGGYWSFSPDGSRAVGLAASITGLQIVNTDNTGFTLISAPLNLGVSKAVGWSPDGSSIAFPIDDGGNPTVGMMTSSGGGQTVVIPGDPLFQYSFFDWYSDSTHMLVSKTATTGTLATDVIDLDLSGGPNVLFTDTTDAQWGNWPAARSLDDLTVGFCGNTMAGPHLIDVLHGGVITEYSVGSPGPSLNQIAWTELLPTMVNPGDVPVPPLGIIASGDSLAGVVRLG